MRSRWVGLTRVSAPVARRRSGFLRGAHHALHSLGMASVLFFAAALNFSLYPNALAAVVGVQSPHIGFVSSELAGNAVPAAPIDVDPADVHLLAATAWAEARSEGEEGMRAVAHVIVNRLGDRFGENLQTVILSPKQFSAWNIGDPNRPLAQNPEHYATAGADKDTWEMAQQVATQVLAGQSIDPTNGALFYHTIAVHPTWDRYANGPLIIGSHIFFHDVPDPPGGRRYRVAANSLAAREARVTRASAGPRAGRVHGVIQHAPASMAHQLLPGEQPGDLPTPPPLTSASATPLPPDISAT